jgi:hypothetical protein
MNALPTSRDKLNFAILKLGYDKSPSKHYWQHFANVLLFREATK